MIHASHLNSLAPADVLRDRGELQAAASPMKALLVSLAISMSGLAFSSQAAATVIDISSRISDSNYVLFGPQGSTPGSGPGVYGVEARGAAKSSWQMGVGPATSQPGFFNQNSAFNWPTTETAFSLTWTSTSISFTANGKTLTNTNGLHQNTLEIGAKGTPGSTSTARITTINGVTLGTPIAITSPSAGGESLLFLCDSPAGFGPGGISLTGYLAIPNSGGSRNEVMFKSGTYTPAVPEPTTWMMMTLGLAGLGFVARRRSARA